MDGGAEGTVVGCEAEAMSGIRKSGIGDVAVVRLASVREGLGKMMSFKRSWRSARDMTRSWLLLPNEKYLGAGEVAPYAVVMNFSAWYFTITCSD